MKFHLFCCKLCVLKCTSIIYATSEVQHFFSKNIEMMYTCKNTYQLHAVITQTCETSYGLIAALDHEFYLCWIVVTQVAGLSANHRSAESIIK